MLWQTGHSCQQTVYVASFFLGLAETVDSSACPSVPVLCCPTSVLGKATSRNSFCDSTHSSKQSRGPRTTRHLRLPKSNEIMPRRVPSPFDLLLYEILISQSTRRRCSRAISTLPQGNFSLAAVAPRFGCAGHRHGVWN